MINQDKKNSIELVESVIETNEEISARKLAAMVKKTLPSKDSDPVQLLKGAFASRGSLMLKAALSERNRQISRTPTKEPAASPDSSQAIRPIPQQQSSSNRKRSPKNKVLFSEPVVTSQYEYEPTFLLWNKHGSSSSESDDSERSGAAKKSIARLKNKQNRYRKEGKKVNSESSDLAGDDDDNELFTMAPSNFLEPVDISKKSPQKRSFKQTLGANDEPEDGCYPTSLPTDDGSLFLSPKVAKIAPYFHNHLDKQSESKSACRLYNDNRSLADTALMQPRSQNLNLPTISCNGASTNLQNQKATAKSLPTNSNQNSEAEDNINEEIIDPDTSRDGYLSWITNGLNYISSQVNKLIF